MPTGSQASGPPSSSRTCSSRQRSSSCAEARSFQPARRHGVTDMAEQPELDLPPPPPAAVIPAPRRRTIFAGFTARQIVAGILVLAAIVWTMWVTKALLAPKQDHLVKVRLSSIVGEYVQAQSRSSSPPAQVEAEMRTFLASLDKELERRSAGGQVVLVGEAV